MIIVFCGEKQSGKSSAAEFVFNQLNGNKSCFLENGNLTYESPSISPEGFLENKNVTIPYYELTEKFSKYIENCGIYNFGDSLKNSINEIFGVKKETLYGSDEDKMTSTDITWEQVSSCFNDVNIKKKIKENNLYKIPITARELMQYFATICRKLNDRCFCEAVERKINKSKSKVKLIADCRFKTEIEFIKEKYPDAIFIRLVKPNDDPHISELELADMPDSTFNLIINTANHSKQEKNQIIQKYLHDNNIL